MQLDLDIHQHELILRALKIEQKSLERAAKAYELEGRRASATAIREELADLVKLTFKVNDIASVLPPHPSRGTGDTPKRSVT